MTDQEILDLLRHIGHFQYPFGKDAGRMPIDCLSFPLNHPAVEKAIASYQDFMIEDLDRFCLAHHSRPAHADGDVGPATRELFAQPRCGCPDYGPDVAAAIGTGSWKSCHGIGNYHSAFIHVDKTKMPGFLKPYWDEVVDRAFESFAEIGLKFVLTDQKSAANITVTFETRRKPWIGLANVGSRQPCNSTIWAQFHAGYQPSKIVSMWTQLTQHEWGHNCGLQHVRGGKMSATLMVEQPLSWIGDPVWPFLKRLYGGEPIPGGPEPPGPPPPVPDDGGYHGILLRSDGAKLDCTVKPRRTSPI